MREEEGVNVTRQKDASVYANVRSAEYRELTVGQQLAVWGVHAFTMTGVAWAALALLALSEGKIKMMWLWLGIALVVDGIDGTLARKAHVRERVPWFDGEVLDNIIDYITWTFIPAIFLFMYVPFGSKPVAMALMILVCASSTFCYCNTGEKSSDNYFVGFPAAWNIVAAYLWLLETGPVANIIVVLALSILTLTPVTFLHPFRVRSLMVPNLVAVVVWLVSLIWLIAVYPAAPLAVQVAWWVSGIWFIGVGVWRTIRGAESTTE